MFRARGAAVVWVGYGRRVRTLETWRRWARELKRDTYALYLAMRDPRVPWYAKALAAAVVAYAFSPIDLIPDFIPVLGYVDDLLLVPLGIALARRLIPAPVMAECRREAAERIAAGSRRPRAWIGATAIVAVWLLLAGLTGWLILHTVGLRGAPGFIALQALPLPWQDGLCDSPHEGLWMAG